jgi:glycosyltransferase-like protein
MLTYSVKPRGGVVHTLEISEALARRGHEVEIVALARPGESFFRSVAGPVRLIRHEPAETGFDERVEGMIAAYVVGLRPILDGGGFDLVHAQDCLSSSSAAELRDEGLVSQLVRTVHHVDDFTSPSLVECQERSIRAPDQVLCVSAPWVTRLAEDFGVEAGLVRNGVDGRRFRPPASAEERRRERLEAGLDGRLAVLAVGGIEPRKGSLTLLEGFAELCRRLPELEPLLIVAGGATLFDYRDEIGRFHARAGELGLSERIRATGSLAPAELERLYRAADLFACPSVKEGFGLVALEALAAELPTVASDLDVFRTFLEHERTALLTPVGDGAALGEALARLAHDPALRERLRARGRALAREWSWDTAAAEHERAYRAGLRRLIEPSQARGG